MIAIVACSGNDLVQPASPVRVASAEIAPGPSSLQLADSLTLTATVRDSGGIPLSDRTVTWSSSDTSIATVVSIGPRTSRVYAIQPGSVTISAAVEGKSAGFTLRAIPPQVPLPPQRAFLYSEADGMTEIASLPGATWTDARDVNDAGQVVGSVTVGGREHAFPWSRENGMVDLGIPGGWERSYATAINQLGSVVGYVLNTTGQYIGATQAFRWSPSTGMVLLPTLPDFPNGAALDINNKGVIV